MKEWEQGMQGRINLENIFLAFLFAGIDSTSLSSAAMT